MNLEPDYRTQLELALTACPRTAPLPPSYPARRGHVARWWFSRMREVVANAPDRHLPGAGEGTTGFGSQERLRFS